MSERARRLDFLSHELERLHQRAHEAAIAKTLDYGQVRLIHDELERVNAELRDAAGFESRR